MLGKTFCADTYSQLSEFFKEPAAEFVDDVASGRLHEYFKGIFSSLGHDVSLVAGLMMRGDVYTILKEEYRKLFVGPLPPYIVPVESVYKKWTNDPDCSLPIAGQKGYLMGDPAMDMIKRYKAHGLVIPDKYSSMPDHIALELEYMSFLCRNTDIETRREFIFAHLDWADELAKDIRDLSGNSFYSLCAKITALVIAKHKVKLSS